MTHNLTSHTSRTQAATHPAPTLAAASGGAYGARGARRGVQSAPRRLGCVGHLLQAWIVGPASPGPAVQAYLSALAVASPRARAGTCATGRQMCSPETSGTRRLAPPRVWWRTNSHTSSIDPPHCNETSTQTLHGRQLPALGSWPHLHHQLQEAPRIRQQTPSTAGALQVGSTPTSSLASAGGCVVSPLPYLPG